MLQVKFYGVMEEMKPVGRGCVVKVTESRAYYSDICCKLTSWDWLSDIPPDAFVSDLVEVHFKNTRKGIYQNVNGLKLKKGDIVAVEASPGHDIGIVTLTGELVLKRLRGDHVDPAKTEFRKIYRLAKPADLEKWKDAIAMEHRTMLRARKIAADLGLSMKIGDVEYQGDKTKAVFYYIADERVDFRSLIKVLAEEFRVRIEMRQIGARQEAGRIGGIGTCGRELCCASWMNRFVSVSTSAAKYQELSLNPLKLAGQCGKLKCCLNYELDIYLDAQKQFPRSDVVLETLEGTYYHQKTDIFKRVMWYSSDPHSPVNLVPVPVERVVEIQEMNKRGEKADKLTEGWYVNEKKKKEESFDFENVVGQDSLTRFDKKNPRRKKKKRNKRRNNRRER